jgi:hypothetical protein
VKVVANAIHPQNFTGVIKSNYLLQSIVGGPVGLHDSRAENINGSKLLTFLV